MAKIVSKSEVVKIQMQIDSKKAKGGSLGSLGSTLGHLDNGKPSKVEKDALKGLKSNNWIGSEYGFQVAVAKLLDAKGLDWFHCPNEAKRSPQLGARLKKAGMKAGIPDVIILNKPKMINFHQPIGMVIELKVGKNKRSEHQEYWGYKFAIHDWVSVVAYGLEDVEKLIEKHYDL